MDDFLAKNINAIKGRTPAFAALLEKDHIVDWIDEVEADDGSTNVVVRTESDPFLIHDNSNPILEAEKKAEETSFKREFVSVVVGAGCGYFVKAALERMENKHVIILVEPVLHMLKIALRLNDFSESIKKGDLLFALTREDIDYQISLVDRLKNVENWLIPIENYTARRPEEYNQLIQHVFLLITQLRANAGTVMGAGKLMANNDIISLPDIIRNRGVKELEGLYKGKPAILVNTGPSLQKNVHLLMPKEVQERFIIIAVGQAYRVLKSYDIEPDFLCSVDFGPVNWGHYKGLLDSDVPLVAINRTYAPILKHWGGPKFISVPYDSQPNDETLSGLLANKGGLLQGGSVSHMAFGLAIALGCDPIVITGQDLGWEGENSHHPLTDEAGKVDVEKGVHWEVNDPRSTIKGHHDMGPKQMLNGYYGYPINTMACYVSYLSTFERFFRQFDGLVEIINSTEGGARIEGSKQMTLQEVIERDYGKIDKSIIKPLLELADDKDYLIEKSIEIMEKDMKNLDDIIINSQRSLVLLKRMKEGNKDRKKLAKRLEENTKVTLKAKRLAEQNHLVALSVFWAGRTVQQKIYSQANEEINKKLKEDKTLEFLYTKEGRNILKTRIEANEIVMQAARDTAKELKGLYKSTLEDMIYLRDNGCPRPCSSINPAPDLSDADTYLENGNWGYPLIEARRILGDGFEVVEDEMDPYTLEPGVYISQENLDKMLFEEKDEILQAQKILKQCLGLRQRAINHANWNYDRSGKDKIIKYNHFIEMAHKEGKNQRNLESKERNFEKALDYLEQAFEYDPERPEAIWGMATTYHGLGDLEEEKGNKEQAEIYQKMSVDTYKDLVAKYPENTRFKFELALVLMRNGNGKDADKIYSELYKETTEYDFFLKSLAKLYYKAGMNKEAESAIRYYIQKFPFDQKGKEILQNIINKADEMLLKTNED